MKNLNAIISLSLISAIGINIANATTHIITADGAPSSPEGFNPSTVNAVCGDTIRWTWIVGGHVVGPISPADIPNGAAGWNAPIDASNLSFEYVVTVPGNYHYVCHPAFPHGEDAYLVVTCATGIAASGNNRASYASPNPFSDKFFIETILADRITICNLLGVEIKSISLKRGQTSVQVDAAELNPGIYFYTIIKEGVIIETRKLVKQGQ